MSVLEVPSLVGRVVRLEPLHTAHVDQLVAAASEDRATYDFAVVSGDTTAMMAQVEGLLRDFDAGLVVPFVQVDVAANRLVGMTRYLTIRTRPHATTPFAVEIGGTWLAASAQRSGINTEAKFLQTMRTGKKPEGVAVMPPMPVDVYVNMKDEDLKAIFAYLKTIKPIRNAVRAGLPPPAPAKP